MKKIFAMLFPSQAGFVTFSGSGRKTVDNALVHFNKAIEELKSVKNYHDTESARQESIALAAVTAQNASIDEAYRAARLAVKLEDLLA